MNEEMEMTTELEPVEEEEMELKESSGIGTGLAMLIGSGLTLAAIAGGRKLMKMWADHKAKKEQSEVTVEIFDDFEDDDDESDLEEDDESDK